MNIFAFFISIQKNGLFKLVCILKFKNNSDHQTQKVFRFGNTWFLILFEVLTEREMQITRLSMPSLSLTILGFTFFWRIRIVAKTEVEMFLYFLAKVRARPYILRYLSLTFTERRQKWEVWTDLSLRTWSLKNSSRSFVNIRGVTRISDVAKRMHSTKATTVLKRNGCGQ